MVWEIKTKLGRDETKVTIDKYCHQFTSGFIFNRQWCLPPLPNFRGYIVMLFHCVDDFLGVQTQYGVKVEKYFPTEILKTNQELETKGDCLFLTKFKIT